MSGPAPPPGAAPSPAPGRGWRKALTILFVASAFGFLGWTVWKNWGEVRRFDWEVRPGLLLLSLLGLSAVLVWGVKVWQLLLLRLGQEVAFRPLARMWLLSNLGRYIPGTVWQFVGMAQLASAAGLSGLAMVTSLAVLMGFTLLSAALVAVCLVPPSAGGAAGALVPVLRWTAPLALLLVHPRVIGAGLGTIRRLSRRPVGEWTGSWGDGVLLLLLTSASWLLYGVAFWAFLESLTPLGPEALLPVTGMNALAFLVGYAVVFAPGGIGPKEASLTVLLSTLLPGGVAASLAVAARLWTVAAEVLPALLFLRQRGTGVAAGPRREEPPGR